ncbi:MAG: lip1 3, partial [Myxococcaceae bacterium]|nr:lip1 3 [Myxococcaceae bacterium]
KVYGNPDNVTDETIDRYHALLLREGHRHSMVQYFRVLRKYAGTEELVQHIPEIKQKTMLMFGEKDRWVPPPYSIERWQHDLPEIEVKTYPEAGHIPMEEFPEETARDAFAFLSDGAEMAEPSAAAESAEPAPKAKAAPKAPASDDEEGEADDAKASSGSESAAEEDEEPPPAPARKSESKKVDMSMFDEE